MDKYLFRWDIVSDKTLMTPKERKDKHNQLSAMVLDDMKFGPIVDWGEYPGDESGFLVVEGTVDEIQDFTKRYTSVAKFNRIPVISNAELELKDKKLKKIHAKK